MRGYEVSDVWYDDCPSTISQEEERLYREAKAEQLSFGVDYPPIRQPNPKKLAARRKANKAARHARKRK